MVRSDEFFRYLLTQLGYRAPTIITFLVGLVLSAVFWSRRPRQSMLVMVASIVALATSVGNALAFSYLVSRGSISSRQATFTAVSVITSFLSVVPYILLFIAALSGRSEQAAFRVQMPPPPFANRS